MTWSKLVAGARWAEPLPFGPRRECALSIREAQQVVVLWFSAIAVGPPSADVQSAPQTRSAEPDRQSAGEHTAIRSGPLIERAERTGRLEGLEVSAAVVELADGS